MAIYIFHLTYHRAPWFQSVDVLKWDDSSGLCYVNVPQTLNTKKVTRESVFCFLLIIPTLNRANTQAMNYIFFCD